MAMNNEMIETLFNSFFCDEIFYAHNISIIGVATRFSPEAGLIVEPNPAELSITRLFHGR